MNSDDFHRKEKRDAIIGMTIVLLLAAILFFLGTKLLL